MYSDSVGVGMAIFVYLIMAIGNFTYIFVVFLPVYRQHYGHTDPAVDQEVQSAQQ